MVEPNLVGSGILPFRGRVLARVAATDAATLTDGGRQVSSLAAGRYDITVDDTTSHAGFSVRKTGAERAIAGTTARFVGEQTRQVTLSAGIWTYFSTSAEPTSFAVVR